MWFVNTQQKNVNDFVPKIKGGILFLKIPYWKVIIPIQSGRFVEIIKKWEFI